MAEIGIPVALDVHRAVFKGEPVRRGQLVGAFKKGFVHGAVLEGQVGAHGFGVYLTAETRMLQQALDLAAKQKLARLGFGIIERFNAKNIPCTVHFVGLGVPHNKGEHPAQLGCQRGAVFLIPVQDDLGIAVGGKDMPLGLQLGAQLHKVVNFAVEHHHHGAVLVIHRLLSGGKVDDAQPAEPQRHSRLRGVTAEVVPLHIRAAMNDAVRHFMQDGLALGTQPGKAYKSTHSFYPLYASNTVIHFYITTTARKIKALCTNLAVLGANSL